MGKKKAGGIANDAGLAISNLWLDNFYITGYFENEAWFGKGEPNETKLTATGGNHDIFIARYNSDGMLIWVKQAGGLGYDDGNSVTTLIDSSSVIAGYFEQSATFGFDEWNETTINSKGEADIFIARYAYDGKFCWVTPAGGIGYDFATSINSVEGLRIIAGGNFEDTAIFGPDDWNIIRESYGAYDGFVALYNIDSTVGWVKQVGGEYNDYCNGIAALSDYSIITTGYFRDKAVFGKDEPNETILSTTGSWERDIYISKFAENGNLVWAKSAGGNYDDSGNAVIGLSGKMPIVTGYFTETATFGKGETNQTTLNAGSAGNVDIFIARYNFDGTLSWAKSAGGLLGENSFGMTLFLDKPLITGQFNFTATFGAGEDNETLLISEGSNDIFIALYEP